MGINDWHGYWEGPTDKGNRVGHWSSGWLKGEWKCPHCGISIGKNLQMRVPLASVKKHMREVHGDKTY